MLYGPLWAPSLKERVKVIGALDQSIAENLDDDAPPIAEPPIPAMAEELIVEVVQGMR